jgi:chemotaxis protein histidine kinase CheA
LSAELAVHKKAEKAVANAKAKAKRAAEKAEKANSKAKPEPKSAPKAKPESAPKAKPKSAPKKKAPAAPRTQRKPPSKAKPAPAPAPTKQIKHLPKRGTFQGRLRKGRDYLTAHNKRTLGANAELADLDCQGEVMQYDDDTEVEGNSERPDEEGSGLVEAPEAELTARARLEDVDEDEEEEEDGDEELYDLFDPAMPWLDGCWEVAWGWPKRRDEDDDEHPNRGSDGGWQGGLCA